MYQIFMKKPENWDRIDKANARWHHGSLIGSSTMARAGAVRVMDSPTTTQYQKDLASQIKNLTEQLEASLRAERINC